MFIAANAGTSETCKGPASSTEQPAVHLLTIFGQGSEGGNLAPIVANANGMSDQDMQDTAIKYKHESGFVLDPPEGSKCDYQFRYWVMNHEMEMCGHATVGAVWLLDNLGMLTKDELLISTLSGQVEAHVTERSSAGAHVEVSQPVGQVQKLSPADSAQVLSALGIQPSDLSQHPIQNASTSRVKTLVPIKDVKTLNGLKPDFARMEQTCTTIGSTGLYPYAVVDQQQQVFAARQFPKSSGYPEDAATGIAAAALAFGLLQEGLVEATGQAICIQQGLAMGQPSTITIHLRVVAGSVAGCWLGGAVRLESNPNCSD